jgi:uncharacterized membrane protein
MPERKWEFLSLLVIYITLLFTILFYNVVPDIMPVHWDVNFRPDSYLPKLWGLLFLPGMMVLLYGLLTVILEFEPLRKATDSERRSFLHVYSGLKLLLLLFFAGFQFLLILQLVTAFIMPYIVAGIIIILIYCALTLRYVPQNSIMGFRTPWTLKNKVVWQKTHDLSAKLLIAECIFILIFAFYPNYFIAFLIVSLIIVGILPFAYSFSVYRAPNRPRN